MKFKHFILRDSKSHGCTIAFDYNEKKSLISFSVAQCHKKDVYCKKTGRDIAIDKFLNGNKITVYMSRKAYHTPARREGFLETIAEGCVLYAH